MKERIKKVLKVVGKIAPLFIFISALMLCTIVPIVAAKSTDVIDTVTSTTTVITTTAPVTTTSTSITTTKATTTTEKTSTTAKPTEKETTVFYETTTKAITKATTPTTVAQVSAPSGEYATAREIWNYMKAQGWNNYVCAGIMGNIMAEVGGSTLNLHPTIYSPGGDFYGICQWSLYYCPKVKEMSLYDQLNYLKNTMESQINMFSSNHGYTYSSFLQIQNAQTAARAFAIAYERCASSTYSIRENNAAVAYAYFVG